ncbi:ethylbenzene dehydrogenase-related protein [Microbulbifer halophilus]|uniref:Ethylbenzene dehydrogenase-related protein n=1 Tax=Microbulbifer halophilus TaxID=453963 RepID=A0ABW5EAN8_9GAMM|nr:ethylbenzene dehydrogenase-related protein [Microbulbifer halophilus]MCW8125747.1 ethylbenzene dehydrogenase-related protein [Microbulbifer halophilus]
MTKYSKSNLWILFHTAAVLALLVNLSSGLRIATLRRPAIAQIAELLPDGRVHQLHFLGACALTAIACAYLLFRLYTLIRGGFRSLDWKNFDYHRCVIWGGCAVLAVSLASGWLLLSDTAALGSPRELHFAAALGMLLYLFFHGGSYLLQYGRRALLLILRPTRQPGGRLLASAAVATGVVLGGWHFIAGSAQHSLPVLRVSVSTPIHIDGAADETEWTSAQPLTLSTEGGANFANGNTPVTLRALHNTREIYFLISWRDPTESLTHLPLRKTENGWQVQQDGFHRFDETRYYEDKFAVLLSDACDFGAAGTAHLGRKPLDNKPANWHGHGYHYSDSDRIHDLWHWKAVRTNDMYLADDNFIGPPDIRRPGRRRYTAGYRKDGKESGSYVMNWQWYRPDTVIPKRLPRLAEQLARYESAGGDSDWVIPWFDFAPYAAENDDFPEGTLMPSVIYSSNRFEGDRADVRARARWRDGRWTLELARPLDTGSAKDVAIHTGTCLWVSAFDRAQVAHTRHNRPIRLELE